MDPFTQKMLLKAEQRSKVLATKCVEPPLPLREFNQFQSAVVGGNQQLHARKPVVTKTVKKTFNDNENKEDINVEINITTTPNVDVQVEVTEKDAESEDEVVAPAPVRDNSRNRLHRLGALYSNTQDLSSPISRTEHKFCAQAEPVDLNPRREKEKLGKLVALAATIREWEDDDVGSSQPHVQSHASKAEHPPPKPPHVVKHVAKVQDAPKPAAKTIDMMWDSKVLNSLEAQGFQRKPSLNTKVQYDFGHDKENASKPEPKPSTSKVQFKTVEEKQATTHQPKVITAIKSNSVSSKIKAFECETDAAAKKPPKKDPTELSLKERMQLFEKNKGPALVPKSYTPAPISVKKLITPNYANPTNSTIVTAPIDRAQREKVFTNEFRTKTISESSIASEIEKQKKADMEVILNRFKRNIPAEVDEPAAAVPTPPPPPPPQPSTPKVSLASKRHSTDNSDANEDADNTTDDSKRAKMGEVTPKGRLYPTLSKFEKGNESYSVEDVTTTPSSSFSSYRNHDDDDSYMEDSTDECFDEKKPLNTEPTAPPYSSSEVTTYNPDSSLTSDHSAGGLTDYLDEALEEDTEAGSSIPEETEEEEEKEVVPSVQQTLTATTSNKDDTKVITLVHTVSFYRRQQGNQSATPTRKIVRNERIAEESFEEEGDSQSERQGDDTDEDNAMPSNEALLVKEKTQKLLDEVMKQQTVIGQTSQALNLCASTIEFSGSTESVEGERHLLVATHRRQTALDEIQRLRVEEHIRPPGAPKDKGRLTVTDITIPLQSEYIRKLSNDTISGHHLVCLLKYNETVLATKIVPTLPGLLSVKFPDVLVLDNVYADFRVTVEIYGMTAQREVLPHEVKYHIDVNKKTPKRRNKDSRLINPMPQSPAVNLIRKPAFVQYGFAIFSLREVQRQCWTLTRVASVSPLEGTVNMKIDCELEVSINYKGFLTMFQEISGFGAWHRRWFRLSGHILNYWKYPDDEKRKAPIGSIDLTTCCSPRVQAAPRDVCARLNTFLVECSRQPEDNDFESLTIIPKGNVTIVRNLLSADSKDERELWCAHLNKALALIRV